ncbi:MAG: DUF2339 domain-containing protein [Candidatus Sungbacteria bacterium]|nr:DUF2339 domain-containing protein [Candidatus Sungbacteria bacterium]
MDEELRQRLEAIENRLSALETRFDVAADQISGKDFLPQPPSYTPEKPAQNQWWQVPSAQRTVSEKLGIAEKTGGSVESYIGRWVLGVVGIVAVIFGASFLLKYAFDNNLIGPAGRVALGIIGGLIFVALGEFFRPRLAKYSYILSGGGLALFYLSIYGAFHFYGLIGQETAFGFMIVVTIFGVALSIWADAVELAGLAAFGGFLTPFLLSAKVPNDMAFFSYLEILALGIFATAFFKKWHQLTLLGFIGMMINFASWYGGYYDSSRLVTALFVLFMFYATFLLASFAGNVMSRHVSDPGDLFIFTINPAWFFGWCYFLLQRESDYERFLGFLAAGLGALYIFLAYFANALNKEDRRLPMFLGAIAVVFLTIAVPLELDQNAITIAWAVEAAVLFALGVILQNPGMRIFGVGVLVIALIRLSSFDSGAGDLVNFLPIFNRRFFTYFMTIVASGVMAYFSVREREKFSSFERGISLFLGSLVNLLILIIITMEISTFFDSQINDLNRKAMLELERGARRAPITQQTTPPYLQVPYQYEAERRIQQSQEYQSLNNQRNASISVFWTIYAILLISFGVMYQKAFLRWWALGLFGLTIGKVFLFDLAILPTPYRIISFMVLGIILLLASWFYFKRQRSLENIAAS